MLFMIIECFRIMPPTPVYERFNKKGRLAPDGLTYISSWVSKDLKTCYQVMQTDERRLLDEWIENWEDLVKFEVIEVITSGEASAFILGKEKAIQEDIRK